MTLSHPDSRTPSFGGPSASVRTPNRRGVLLIVVLSMLTLFMLLGTTYIILASRARTVSRAYLKLADDQPGTALSLRPILRDAAFQVIRGTQRAGSVLQYHDLLGDRYGSSTEYAIANAEFLAAGQLLRFSTTPSPGQVTGQVVTFIDGPAAVRGTSHRIVEHDGSWAYVIRPPSLSSPNLLAGVVIRINGRDFVGSGFSPDDALRPNWSQIPITPDGTTADDYDRPDDQNVALSWAVQPQTPGTELFSYHRPASVNFWRSQFLSDGGSDTRLLELLTTFDSLSATQQAALTDAEWDILKNIRRASLRPFAFDHRAGGGSLVDFAGKQPVSIDSLTSSTDLLDVDNDHDGELDSVWLDIGYPPFQMPDRTLVKPLAAIKCIDLGGRIDLNAHGSLAHLLDPTDIPAAARGRLARNDDGSSTTNDDLEDQVQGSGFGPADVRLDALLNASQVDAVLQGIADSSSLSQQKGIRRRISQAVGRYGDKVASVSSPAFPGRPGVSGTATMAISNAARFANTPSDLWGRFLTGIDHRGHPLRLDLSQGAHADTVNSPYELNLLAPRDGNPYAQGGDARTASWIDQPFTPAEMEAVLRVYDSDNAAILPPRALAIILADDLDDRHLVTTETWDTPAVIGGIPAVGGINLELRRGLRMDINRPFGDGKDSSAPSNDGIVDDPHETGYGPDDRGDLPTDPTLQNASDPFGRAKGNSVITNWADCILTRGQELKYQPGPPLAGLRARQIMADNIFRLLVWLEQTFPATANDGPKLWLFSPKPGDAAVNPASNLADKVQDPSALSGDHVRRIFAQWAVNVVDFLDSDSIMTPYRYDASAVTIGHDNVVWGCEHPDVIITETLAFHDRAVADTARDTGQNSSITDADPTKRDNDFDQIRLPQGSVFVELHALRDPRATNLPAELYGKDENNQWYLDLGRTPTGGTAPVWRLSFAPLRNTPTEGNDIFALLRKHPDTESLSPKGNTQSNLIGSDRSYDLQLSRYVWFTNTDVGDASSASDTTPNRFNTFTLAGGTNKLGCGKFLVTGPRPTTYLGAKPDAASYGKPSAQRITLSASTAVIHDPDNQVNPSRAGEGGFDSLPPAGGNRPETLGCWVQSASPKHSSVPNSPDNKRWSSTHAHAVGLNISEKRADDYYTEPPATAESDGLTLSYGSLDKATGTYPDSPQDNGSPISNAGLLAQGTHRNASTVYAERLADPTRPHDPRAEIVVTRDGNDELVTNPAWNPYIVVDFMPIDLTVFNGEETFATIDPPAGSNKPVYFHTRQRGFDDWFDFGTFDLDNSLFSNTAVVAKNPLRPSSPYKKTIGADLAADLWDFDDKRNSAFGDAHFNYALNRVLSGTEQDSKVPYHTLGWTNLSFGRRLSAADVSAEYAGAPSVPLPWVVWHDRPFANEFELTFVPRTSAARLLTNYRDLGAATDEATPPFGVDLDQPFGAIMPGAHLMPFTSITDRPLGSTPKSRNANLLSRLFSYVRVPSPFAGTHAIIDSGDSSTPPVFRGPFNAIPTYREPGKVNINTIPDAPDGDRVWNALAGLSPAAPAWSEVNQLLAANPFRTPAATGTSFRNQSLLSDAPPTASSHKPLFPAAPSGALAFSAEHSAWFRMHPLIQAASNTTTRSEVYAIWVTLGLFEVENTRTTSDPDGFGRLKDPNPPDPTKPDPTPLKRYHDGFRLVREYGSQSGDMKRFRAFFIFDRSRPVCYEPGANHNISDGILVERYIE
jgi:hypothetical protein